MGLHETDRPLVCIGQKVSFLLDLRRGGAGKGKLKNHTMAETKLGLPVERKNGPREKEGMVEKKRGMSDTSHHQRQVNVLTPSSCRTITGKKGRERQMITRGRSKRTPPFKQRGGKLQKRCRWVQSAKKARKGRGGKHRTIMMGSSQKFRRGEEGRGNPLLAHKKLHRSSPKAIVVKC